MTLLSLDLRKIGYHTPYSRQVMPKHRNTVRMNHKLTVEEDMQRKKSYQHGKSFDLKVLTKEGNIRLRTSKNFD
jgi:hypothetical protein